MPADITIIQLSDTHLLADPERRLFGVDPVANLQRTLAAVAALPLRPDLYIISGDLTNDGEPAAYDRLRALIEPIEASGTPVLVGLGNHDERVAFRRSWLGESAAVDPEARYYYSRRIGDLRVIMLDSMLVGQVPGALDRPQLDWLAAELRETAPAGTLLVMHHPVVARGVRRATDYLLQNADELADVLAGGRDLLGLLVGHLHMPSIAQFAGILTATTPAVIFQFDPSIARGERVTAGCGFTLGSVRDGHLIINPILLPGDGALLRPAE